MSPSPWASTAPHWGLALFAAFLANTQSKVAAAKASDPQSGQRPRVYLFRGFARMAFSRGVDTLAEMIRYVGLSAAVNKAIVYPIIA